MGIIYCYTNKVNGKKYIGQTIHPDQRKRNHLCEAMKGSDYYFHRAIRKHGIENFTYEVLEESEDLNKRETEYIIEYNSLWPNGYNQILEHNGMPEDVREKISNTKKRQWEELSEEKKQKKKDELLKAATGRPQTDKQKKSVTEANQKQWIITEPSGKSYQIKNLRSFCKEHGLDQGNMTNVAHGKLRHYKQWKCSCLINIR